jgi:signal transduction histidine kinase
MRSPRPKEIPPSPFSGQTPLTRRLAASVAHHVNNALTGVIANLELSLRLVSSDAATASYLRDSLAYALRAADAVKRIVSYAYRKPPAATPAPVSLRSLAAEAVDRLRSRCGPGVSVQLGGDSSGWAAGSESLLRSALDQLLDNAAEAVPGGGAIWLVLEDDGDRRYLHVCDTGSGIPAEVQGRLFEPFVTTKALGHLGLGLALCRELLQAQGGEVRVVSVAGQGTVVSLSLPALAPAEGRRSRGGMTAKDQPHRATAPPHHLTTAAIHPGELTSS